MRLNVLAVMGLIAALGLAAAIVALPVMANKGPQRVTLVAPLGGAQEQKVQTGGNSDGRGRAVVKVFEEKLCARVKTGAIESSSSVSSSSKATLHLGMSGEKGPTSGEPPGATKRIRRAGLLAALALVLASLTNVGS